MSATVGTENDLFEKIWLYNKLKSDNEPGFQQLQEKSIKSDDVDSQHLDAKTEVASTITGNGEKVLMSPMGEWMDIDTHNEMCERFILFLFSSKMLPKMFFLLGQCPRRDRTMRQRFNHRPKHSGIQVAVIRRHREIMR